MVDTRRLRSYLSDYIERAQANRRASLNKITLYVVLDSRVKALVDASKTGILSPWRFKDEGPWSVPSPLVAKAIQSQDSEVTADRKAICYPITVRGENTTDCVGALYLQLNGRLRVEATKRPRADASRTFIESITADVERAQLQARIEWQNDILQTARLINRLEYKALNKDALFKDILAAALTVAPTACLAHLITVNPDPMKGTPISLTLEYALASEVNRPTSKPIYLGRCEPKNPDHTYSIEDSFTGLCVNERECKHFATRDSVQLYRQFHERTESEVCFPLIVGDQVIGVLNFESEVQHAFTQRDFSDLEIIAHEVALILWAVSGAPTLAKLYEMGLQAYQRILDSLETPREVVAHSLEWARTIVNPPFEYAQFTPEGPIPGLELLESGVKPAVSSADTVLTLDHHGTKVGTILLLTARTSIPLIHNANVALKQFPNVLAAAIHTSLMISRDLPRHAPAWLASAIRHTLQEANVIHWSGVEELSIHTTDTYWLKYKHLDAALVTLNAASQIFTDMLQTRETDGRIDVRSVVKEVHDALKWQFVACDISLEFVDRIPEELSPRIKGGSAFLKLAVWELLGNALKYSRYHENKHVQVAIHYSTKLSREVLIRVEDGCPCIKDEELQHVRQKGKRGTEAIAGGVPGSGLGLHIVETCCNELEGFFDIQVSPSLQGNSFELKFESIEH